MSLEYRSRIIKAHAPLSQQRTPPTSSSQPNSLVGLGGRSASDNRTPFLHNGRPQHRMIPTSGPVGVSTGTTGSMDRRWNSTGNSRGIPYNDDEPEENMNVNKWRRQTRTIAHYERLKQIGEGTYGQVYKARCLDSGRTVAMKKIRLHHGGYWGMPPTVIREVKILKALRHPNMVEMIEVVSSKGYEYLDKEDEREEEKRKRQKEEQANNNNGSSAGSPLGRSSKESSDLLKHSNSVTKKSHKKDRILDAREGFKGNLFLVLEYVSHDLTGLMDMRYKFTEVQVKCIFRQLLDVLSYIHDHKYVHRDLKSSNILIDSHFRVKLADFGLARCIAPSIFDNTADDRTGSDANLEFTNKVITLWYRPPELLLGATRYGPSVDIWSTGCILAELLLGKPLFTGKNEMDQLKLVFDMMGTPTDYSWEGFKDLKLIRTGEVEINKQRSPKLRDKYRNKIEGSALTLIEKLLELDPNKRLTANRALESRYFFKQPIAPQNPEELGVIKLDGDSHEFQTKQIRREAKVVAQRAVLEAKSKGLDEKEAYDIAYQAHLQKCAEDRAKAAANHHPTNSQDYPFTSERKEQPKKRDRDDNRSKDYNRKRNSKESSDRSPTRSRERNRKPSSSKRIKSTSSKERHRDTRNHQSKDSSRFDTDEKSRHATKSEKSESSERTTEFKGGNLPSDHTAGSNKNKAEENSTNNKEQEKAGPRDSGDKKTVSESDPKTRTQDTLHSSDTKLETSDQNGDNLTTKKQSDVKDRHSESSRKRSRSRDRSRSRSRDRKRGLSDSGKERKESRRRHSRSHRRHRDSSSSRQDRKDRKVSNQREWERQMDDEITREKEEQQGSRRDRGRDGDRWGEYSNRVRRSRSRERHHRMRDDRGSDYMGGERWMEHDPYYARDGPPPHHHPYYPHLGDRGGRNFVNGPPSFNPRFGHRGDGMGPYREPDRERHERDNYDRDRHRQERDRDRDRDRERRPKR